MLFIKFGKILKASKKFLIAGHDAGGGNILCSLVAQDKIDCYFYASGPAEEILKRRFHEDLFLNNINEAISLTEECIVGSGWQTDFEWSIISEFKRNKKKVTTFLDHWCNYKDRFIRNNIECYPDEILVGDKYALDIASKCFENIPIKLVQNPYFNELVESIKSLLLYNSDLNDSGLFLSENLSDNSYFYEYNELTIIDKIAPILINSNFIKRLIIRPHPSDNVLKYQDLIVKWKPFITISNESLLDIDIAKASYIFGCHSTAMVIALMAKKKVFKCISDEDAIFNLPYNFNHLDDLVT